MSYNYWIEYLLKKIDRRTAEVTFNSHLLNRVVYWNLDLDKIEETARNGSLLAAKCEPPGKLCFRLYFGKENITYTIIALFHQEFIEVMTAWPKTGR